MSDTNNNEIQKSIDAVESRVSGIFYFFDKKDKHEDPLVSSLFEEYLDVSFSTPKGLRGEAELGELARILSQLRSRATSLGFSFEDITDEKLDGYHKMFNADFEHEKKAILGDNSSPEKKLAKTIFSKPGIH